MAAATGNNEIASRRAWLRAAVVVVVAFALAACGSERDGQPAPDAAVAAPDTASAGPAPPHDQTVSLLFTTGRRGQLEESGCRRDPLGGLARLATWLKTDPLAGDPDHRLLLSGGDAFLPSPPEPPTSEQRAAAAIVADVYDQLRYDVVALAPRDLDLGPDALLELSRSHRFAVSSANLFTTDSDEPPFQQGLLFSLDGVKIGVVGVMDAAFGAREDRPTGVPWRYRAPLRVVRDQVTRMRERGAELVIVLAQLRDEEIERLARTPGVDLVLRGSGPEDAQPVRQVKDKGWVVYPAGRGENVAVIELKIPAGASLADGFADGNLAERLRERIARLDERLARLEAKRRPGNIELIGKARAERGLLALELEDVPEPPRGRALIRYHLAPIRLDIPEQPDVAARVDAEIERARGARLPQLPTPGTDPEEKP